MKIVPKLRGWAASILTHSEVDRISELVSAGLNGEASNLQRPKLDRILTHASNTVPFYRGTNPSSLENFPIVNKADMAREYNQFLSQPFETKGLRKVSTSGSTGIPFEAYWDSIKVNHHVGSLVATHRFQGMDPFGARIMTKPWPGLSTREHAAALLRGELRHWAGSRMAPSNQAVVRWLKINRGASLIGYSSFVEQLLVALEKEGVSLSEDLIPSVIGTSEAPTPYLDEFVRTRFGYRLRMRYSNAENGVIAVSAAKPDRYIVDRESFLVEILKFEQDEPAAPGTVGRIIITDLHNHAMPFIRYDTGDQAAWAVTQGESVSDRELTSLTGRSLDRIVLEHGPDPRTAHPMEVWTATAELRAARQFQLRQHDVGAFTWVLNADPSRKLENDLRRILEDRIGPVESCSFRYVDEVPVMASGKRQIFVSEISELSSGK